MRKSIVYFMSISSILILGVLGYLTIQEKIKAREDKLREADEKKQWTVLLTDASSLKSEQKKIWQDANQLLSISGINQTYSNGKGGFDFIVSNQEIINMQKKIIACAKEHKEVTLEKSEDKEKMLNVKC